ncbi:unnamed protein product [Fraxinus pennsylvanica]|uniref:Nuclear transcription factor Y subunit n=1 Tax=Fraxinus pennsylvanica TaxID=56036 RepID=A0AAD2AGY1_9LAMI|nr:unnamed protein product [Fraxinus pennsylvanica]
MILFSTQQTHVFELETGMAYNSEADEQRKYSETQIQSDATSHSGIAFPNMNYAMPAQLGAENAVLMGIQQAGVPLPSDVVEEPVFVNAKQYHGILRRRQSCAKAESENKVINPRKVLYGIASWPVVAFLDYFIHLIQSKLCFDTKY